MVRCKECGKTFRQHFGKNWSVGKCNGCFVKARELDYEQPSFNLRLFHSPIDFYLDVYTLIEMRTIDGIQ